jgi:ribosomal protein S18 acetylase RimI-like enzyme
MQPVLDTGTIEKKLGSGTKQKHPYEMMLLEEQHLPQIMGLQKLIIENLNRPELMASIAYDFMKEHVERQGFILGVFVQERLVAFLNIYYPNRRDKEFNLGRDIGFAEDQSTRFANFQMVCVHPGFRGNELADKMNRMALNLLQQKGTCEHVCATVSPYNVCSVRILLNCGFRISRIKMKYGGKLRYIVHQNLYTPMEFTDDEAVYARLDDLDTQKEIFNSGRYGVALAHLQELDSDLKKDLLSRSFVIFKRPSDEQLVHVVKRRLQTIEKSKTIAAAARGPETPLAVQWNIAGDQSVSFGSDHLIALPNIKKTPP